MSKQTYIDGNKTLIDTDYYLKLLNCEQENKKLKEQLHQASIDIQELTERDLFCPSSCDKLIKYKSVLEEIREEIMKVYPSSKLLQILDKVKE